MDQAAQGTEVLVSRHGKPFVRLLGTEDSQRQAPDQPEEIR
jgi:prevent-host-death family protein